MSEAVPDWHRGPAGDLLQGLWTVDDPRPSLGLAEMLQPARLDYSLLQLYGPALMPRHLPVLVSQWSKYYFMQFWPALLVPRLLHGWALPLGFAEVTVALDERGLPMALKPVAAGVAGDCALEPVIAANLRPLITALSAYGGVPAAVLWGNAGDYLEQCIGALQARVNADLAPAWRLLTTAGGPIHEAVRYLEDGRRQRRSCCLSYRVEGIGHCEQCPLSP
ncbi:Ferric iron reductase protein FhuF [compost metagenome]